MRSLSFASRFKHSHVLAIRTNNNTVAVEAHGRPEQLRAAEKGNNTPLEDLLCDVSVAKVLAAANSNN